MSRPVPFPEMTAERWRVRRHEDGGQIIPIRASNLPVSLRNDYEGWCHIYMHSAETVAALLVSTRPKSSIDKINRKVGFAVDILQHGDTEFIVAAPVEHFDKFCRAVGARKKKKLSQAHRDALVHGGQATRMKKGGSTEHSRAGHGQPTHKPIPEDMT